MKVGVCKFGMVWRKFYFTLNIFFFLTKSVYILYFNGLAQDYGNSIANAMELP